MLQGSLFHKAFELYFKDNLSFEEITVKINTMAKGKSNIVANVLLAFRQYLEKYPNKAKEIVIIDDMPSVELPFRIEYDNDNDDNDNIEVIGFIDYIGKRRVKSYITDIKVTSMAETDWYFQGFELSYQTMLYSYVCSKLLQNIDGFIIDAVQIKQNKNSVKVDFNTQFFPLSDNIESFEREMHEIANYINKYRDQGPEYFRHHYTSCVTKYGRCAYHNICSSCEAIQIEYLRQDDSFVDRKSREENEAAGNAKGDLR